MIGMDDISIVTGVGIMGVQGEPRSASVSCIYGCSAAELTSLFISSVRRWT